MKSKQNFDKLEDFAHNYIKIRIKCPECIHTIKGGNHIKVYKNLSGLWWHFKIEHNKISNSQFNTDDIKQVLKKISKALHLGMISFD